MIRKRQNISDFCGKLVFTAMFFFLICAYQDKSYDSTCEMMNQMQPQNSNALIISHVLAPSFQKDDLTDRERNYLSPLNDAHKILTDNNKIHQRLHSLQKIRQITKPDLIFQFYYHLFSENSKDHPVLS